MKHITTVLLALSLSTSVSADPGVFPVDDPLSQDEQIAPVGLTVVVTGPPGELLYMNEELVGFVPKVLYVPEGIHLFRVIDQNGQSCSVEREVFEDSELSRVIEVPC